MSVVQLPHGKLHYYSQGYSSRPNYAVFVHGIMGNARNWQGFLKLFVESFPEWNALIFDLRNHGESSKHLGPFTTESAASDIPKALEILMIEPQAIIGHSFGGKVASFAAAKIPSLRQLWLLDSSFSARPATGLLESTHNSTAFDVLRVLRDLKWPAESRRSLVEVLKAHSLSEQVALWMTTNLVQSPEGLMLNFDPGELELMLRDFVAIDLWGLAKELSISLQIHLLKAEQGSRLNKEDEARLNALDGRHYFHVLKNSGHFVQVDNPSGLIELMRPFFS